MIAHLARLVTTMLLLALASPTLADEAAPAHPIFVSDATARFDADTRDGSSTTGCKSTQALRIGMYTAQSVDALATGANVAHGFTRSALPGFQGHTLSLLIGYAAFDGLIGALMRRSPCTIKNTIALGSSAYAVVHASSLAASPAPVSIKRGPVAPPVRPTPMPAPSPTPSGAGTFVVQ